MAHFLLRRLGASDEKRPPHVAMLLENHLELLVALRRLRRSRALTLFGVNTGLRGETLAGVLNQSRARLLVVDERSCPRSSACARELRHRGAARTSGAAHAAELARRCLDTRGRPGRASRCAYPDVDVTPETNLMVIYTSGTTGLPKGINNNHFKLCATGVGVSMNLGIGPRRRRLRLHAAVPLELASSSASCRASGSAAAWALRERFSASRFVPDVLRVRRQRTGTTWASRSTTCSRRSRRSTAATRRASGAR